MGWIDGLAEWEDGDTTFLSVAFTYKLNEAHDRAIRARSAGRKVIVGGPALVLAKMQHAITDVAEYRRSYPDAIWRHNPQATFASRGCDVDCSFCIVRLLEGSTFTELPDFPVRPILCDNNLSGLSAKYQDHIIKRYLEAGVPLFDANSGFEPITFTEEVYRRWKSLLNAGKGPWRFAYDETKEAPQVREVFKMLRNEPSRRKRVYVLIGNEPFAECMERIREVIGNNCEPHVQPFLDLNALKREPRARFDWTVQQLKDVARWANAWLWRKFPFEEYDRHKRNAPRESYDSRQGLFF